MNIAVPAMVFFLFAAYTGIDEKWVATLPDIVAEAGSIRISRTDALALMRLSGGDSPLAAKDRHAVLKQVIDEELCRIVLRQKLAGYGIKADYENAVAFLKKNADMLPAALRPQLQELLVLANDRDIQLKIALQQYIVKVCPDKLLISDSEIEDFYRENQEFFRLPATVSTGILRLPKNKNGEKQLKKAAALLKQGEKFTSVIGCFKEAIPADDITEEFIKKATAGLTAGEVSTIMELPDSLLIIQLISVTPESYLPLSEVKEHIRQELAGQRTGKELAGEISRIRSKTPVKYHIQWLSE